MTKGIGVESMPRYSVVMPFYKSNQRTSAAPIRVPARATSAPNALLSASEGTRPAAAPDEAAAVPVEVPEVLEVVELEEIDVAVDKGAELVAFAVSDAHSVC